MTNSSNDEELHRKRGEALKDAKKRVRQAAFDEALNIVQSVRNPIGEFSTEEILCLIEQLLEVRKALTPRMW